MTDAPPLAIVRTYAELHAVLRQRAADMKASRNAIDEVAGLTSGYASKLLAPMPMKTLGRTTFALMLQTLGLAIVVVDDPNRHSEKVKNTAQATGRKAMLAPGKHVIDGVMETRALQRHALIIMLRKNGRKGAPLGGVARAKSLTPARRRQIARRAAMIRWQIWRRTREERRKSRDPS